MPKAFSKYERQNMETFLKSQLLLGKNQTEIAKEVGCSQGKISLWVTRLGIQFPKGAGGRDQLGSKNPNYKNGLSRSSIRRMTKTVALVVEKPLNICERCKLVFDYNLNRHHKNRNRADNRLENIEIICPKCHATEHNKERERDKEGRYL